MKVESYLLRIEGSRLVRRLMMFAQAWRAKGLQDRRLALFVLTILLSFLAAALGGCANYSYDDAPEIRAERWAPPAPSREWVPQPGQSGAAPHTNDLAHIAAPPQGAGKPYDLAALINLALSDNPDTRQSWEAARAAAANFAKTRAPFYPKLSVGSANGYERIADQVPVHWGVLKNWQSRTLFELTYTLIDFGRRDASSEAARDLLMAANYRFNRKIQKVVFSTEQAFYSLDAARASVKAAEAIKKLATMDRIAAQKRRDLGLATEPQVLLAAQREAQAVYELENARVMVSNAQADLAVAIGIDADELPGIESLENLPAPKTLGAQVKDLMRVAMARRPDLAARISSLEANRVEIRLAHDQFFPTIGLGGYYGDHAFQYRLSSTHPPTFFTANAPEYSGMVTLKWDLFTGFERHNELKRARARSAQTESELKSLQVGVAAEVWRAYFDFQSAVRKYEYAQALLQASDSAYNSNYHTYRLGLSTIIDLLTAERDLAGAHYSLIRSKADVLISAAEVAYATGAMPETGGASSP